MPDALEVLLKDHRIHETLLKLLLDPATPNARKEEVVDELARELHAHDTIERELFYPAIGRELGEQGLEILKDSYEDHDEIQEHLDTLFELDVEDTAWLKTVQDLAKLAIEHAKVDEEAQLFPRCQQRIRGDVLRDLGEAMAQRKAQVMLELTVPGTSKVEAAAKGT